jgi:hypothetical protein
LDTTTRLTHDLGRLTVARVAGNEDSYTDTVDEINWDGCLGCVLHILARDPVVDVDAAAAVLNDKSTQLAGTPNAGRHPGWMGVSKTSYGCDWSQLHCAHHYFVAREEH